MVGWGILGSARIQPGLALALPWPSTTIPSPRSSNCRRPKQNVERCDREGMLCGTSGERAPDNCESASSAAIRVIHTPVFPVVTHDSRVSAELAARMSALRPALTRFFQRSVRERADAEDLVQDVFLRIVRRGEMETFEGFTNYAFLTATSVLKDRNRRSVVRHLDRHVSFEPETHSTIVPGPDRELIARDELRSTSIVLAQLPERTRSVFVLRRLDGASFAEIGVRLGISVSSAEKHMLKATRHLIAAARDAS